MKENIKTLQKNVKYKINSTSGSEKSFQNFNFNDTLMKKNEVPNITHKINKLEKQIKTELLSKETRNKIDYKLSNLNDESIDHSIQNRRKRNIDHSIYHFESDVFQLIKSANEDGKNIFTVGKIKKNLEEKEKKISSNNLFSAFNCLSPVTLPSKSFEHPQELLLSKRNFAKGDYNMSEEENKNQNAEGGEEAAPNEEVPAEANEDAPAEPQEEVPAEPNEGGQAENTEPAGETTEATPVEEVTESPPEPPETTAEEPLPEQIEGQKEGGEEVKTETKEPEEPTVQEGAPAPPPRTDGAPERASAGQIKKESEKTSSGPKIKEETEKSPSKRSSSDIPYTHSSILQGLEKAKKEAEITTEVIMQLKNKILMYQQKEHLSSQDMADVQALQTELMEKLAQYGDTSKYIAGLVGMSEVPSSQLDMSVQPIPRKPALPYNEKTTSATTQNIVGLKEKGIIYPPVPGVKTVDDIYLQRFSEEKLPQVIVCGVEGIDQVPKIIVCEPMKKKDVQPFQKSQKPCESRVAASPPPASPRAPPRQSPGLQTDNTGNTLEEQLADKQQAIERLHTVISCLKDKVRKLNEENIELYRQQVFSSQPPQPKICRRELYQKVRKTLPSFEKRNGDNFEEDTEERLEGESPDDNDEVQEKLCKQETYPQQFDSGKQPRCKKMLPVKETQTESESEKDKKLRLLEEQYKKLNKDFNMKLSEMAILKVELNKTKQEVESGKDVQKELENTLQISLDTINTLENEKKKLLQIKDQFEDMENDTKLAKQMYLTGQDELEESRMLLEDVTKQLEDYRRKYLYTLTTLEEQKKDMDRKYLEHEERVAGEMQRTKLQLENTEEELKTNKYMLKETQQKLKETQQMHAIALNNIKDLSQSLHASKKEIDRLKEVLDRSNTKANEEKIAALQEKLRLSEKKAEKLNSEYEGLMSLLSRIEETANENERHLEEKTHETKLLQAQMETLREESARQISRSKSTFETMKTSMQIQISKLEAELIQTRTAAYAAKQDKIAIQKKMQMQIAHLNNSINETQTGVLSLEGHVKYLKGSQTSILCRENNCPQYEGQKTYIKQESLLASEAN